MICPRCHQDAPTVVRGARTYCTACGAPRSLLDGAPVNVVGKPSRIGGGVARVVGWAGLIIGLLVALTLGALIQVIAPAYMVGWIVGGFLAAMSLLFGLFFVLGGRMLQKSGAESARGAHEQAVFAIGKQRGYVTPAELARAVSIREDEADALLTEMAKRPDGRVTLEVDDDGTLRYYVRGFEPSWPAQAKKGGARVAAGAPAGNTRDAMAEAELEAEEEIGAKGRARR